MGDQEMIGLLLENKANLAICDADGKDAMFYAAQKDQTLICSKLLKRIAHN